jgi:hypothetical protein
VDFPAQTDQVTKINPLFLFVKFKTLEGKDNSSKFGNVALIGLKTIE